jgi:hypothetical protein
MEFTWMESPPNLLFWRELCDFLQTGGPVCISCRCGDHADGACGDYFKEGIFGELVLWGYSYGILWVLEWCCSAVGNDWVLSGGKGLGRRWMQIDVSQSFQLTGGYYDVTLLSKILKWLVGDCENIKLEVIDVDMVNLGSPENERGFSEASPATFARFHMSIK